MVMAICNEETSFFRIDQAVNIDFFIQSSEIWFLNLLMRDRISILLPFIEQQIAIQVIFFHWQVVTIFVLLDFLSYNGPWLIVDFFSQHFI